MRHLLVFECVCIDLPLVEISFGALFRIIKYQGVNDVKKWKSLWIFYRRTIPIINSRLRKTIIKENHTNKSHKMFKQTEIRVI